MKHSALALAVIGAFGFGAFTFFFPPEAATVSAACPTPAAISIPKEGSK